MQPVHTASEPVEWVLIMRNHSGVPFVHYKLKIDDPDLPVKMAHCGIVGTVAQLREVLSTPTAYSTFGSYRGSNPGGYWVCRGSAAAKVEV